MSGDRRPGEGLNRVDGCEPALVAMDCGESLAIASRLVPTRPKRRPL